MLGIDYFRSVLSSPANHAQGMTAIRFDIYQPAVIQAHFYPAAGRTYSTEAFSPFEVGV
jgi:hypothetical protein